ncbi:MAG TPA: DUF4199 domain-containing protein [Flavobacterium sp.]|jgi:hypothetical protein
MNETVPVSPAKSAILYGVLFGIIMVLELVLSYVLDIDPVSNPAYGITLNVLNMLVLPILFIVIGCNNFKKLNNGFVSLGQCLKIGVTVCLIAALLSAICQSVFYMIFPEYVEEVLRKTRASLLMQNPEMPAEGLEMGMNMTRKFMEPAIMIPAAAAIYSVIGLIYSLIVGAIVKRDNPQAVN